MDTKQQSQDAPVPYEAAGILPPNPPDEQPQQYASPAQEPQYEAPPPLPSRMQTVASPPNPPAYYPSPPKRATERYSEDLDVASPIHYTRDPKKLVAYLVPFPKPRLPNVDPASIPTRYLIYAPPPPPLSTPKEGEKEDRVHKVQRKWEAEIRDAKNSDAKTMSWKGMKSKAVKGINWGMGQTKSSNIEFLNRIGVNPEQETHESHAEDDPQEGEQTKATVTLEEMVLVYPSSMPGSPDEIREEFINTMLRSRSKAQRDSYIATGLLPISFAVDMLITPVWPFGGLLEIDAVWAYASIRGAKNSRSVTKRLTSTSGGKHDEDRLHLNFSPSPRLDVLEKYLAAQCHKQDAALFPYVGGAPTESQALEAIGWFPSTKGGAERNWEDEQWEISEVKEDLNSLMRKAAREWTKWLALYQKQPEKAIKK